MSAQNVYGVIWSAKQVENRVIGALEDWLPYYLGEMERVDGYDPDTIERPRGYVRASEFGKWPEDQIPVVLVITGEARPTKHEDGRYEATFPVGVAPIVSELEKDGTRDLANTYAAAIRSAVVQHKRLKSTAYPDGIEGHVNWTHEGYTDLAHDDTRTLGAASVIFDVTINNVVTAAAGPRELPSEPPNVDPGDWPPLAPGYPHVIVNPVEVLP